VDAETGKTLEMLAAESGVQTPDDLTIAPDGTLYVVNILQGTVVAVKQGDGKVVATLGSGVDGIALSPTGKLIIGKDFLGDGLYEVDPTGKADPRTIDETPGWVNAMAFAPDGTLYAPIWQKKYVARVDVAKGTLKQFSKEFAGTAGAVRFDSKGHLFAVDGGTGDVLRIDLKSGELTRVFHYGLPLDNLAFDAKDRLYISSYADGSVSEVLAEGALRVVKPGGLSMPAGLAVSTDDAESVYVGDTSGVHEFDGLKAVHRGGFGNALALAPTYITPTALRVAGDRLLALGAASVDTWERATGKVDSSLPLDGGGEDVIEFRGDVLVSQPQTGEVVKVGATSATAFTSGLGDPAGLAASDKDVFVTIYTAGEIRQIARDGAVLDKPRVVVSGLHAPEGIAVLNNGHLAVVETGTGNLLEIDPATGKQSMLARALLPPAGDGAALATLHALGVGASGCLYVLSPAERRVYRSCSSAD
jgi:sugar lactone lactonase YvrE